jgi:hypothetical protein
MGFFWHSAEDRWDRVAKVMLVMGGIVVAAAGYGFATGDDARGAVMTAAPGALMLGIGWMAIRQRDRIIYGTPPTIVDWVARGAGVIGLVLFALGVNARRTEGRHHQEVDTPIVIPDDVEIGEIPGPNGTMIKSLVRKSHREDCPESFIADPQPADPNRPTGHCATPELLR